MGMTDVTAEQITNQFLYGEMSPPENLLDPALIRPTGQGPAITLDVVSFMTSGAGRFALGAMSDLVKEFFERATDFAAENKLEVGRKYNKSEMAAILGLTSYGIEFTHWQFQGEDRYDYDRGEHLSNAAITFSLISGKEDAAFLPISMIAGFRTSFGMSDNGDRVKKGPSSDTRPLRFPRCLLVFRPISNPRELWRTSIVVDATKLHNHRARLSQAYSRCPLPADACTALTSGASYAR